MKTTEGKREQGQVRFAGTGDFDAVCDIGEFGPRDPRRLALHQVIERGECLVSEMDHNVVAVVIVERQRFFGRDFISLLKVAPEWRGQDVGRGLLLAAVDVDGTDSVFTSTNASNTAMRGLLESLSWTFSGTLEGLDGGDPELIFFSRRLPDTRKPSLPSSLQVTVRGIF